jgi:hypothetical protein
MGLAAPAGRADAKSSGAGTGPAATAATSATAAAPATPATSAGATSAGAASLAASWTSLLHKNCHLESSLVLLLKIGITIKLHSQIHPNPLQKRGDYKDFLSHLTW